VDVGAWLRSLGLERYEQTFRDNDVDAEVLPELTADDLIGLGITSVGHRRKLLAAVAALRAGPAPSAAAPSPAEPGTPPAARSGEAERRQLTVAFVDLVGSTELSRRLDPEDMRGLIRAYQNLVAGEVTRFEGHVAKYMGDGVLAYFGWPRAHEDDAERAVRAGLAVAAAVPGLAAPAGERLAARIGIATGPVVVGELIGSGKAREREVVGETPNLAARLQALAEPGAVVVAEGTRRLLGGLFALRDLGASALKGFAEPVRAFAVAGEGAAEGRFEAMHAAGLTPLVGREQELALLLDRWERAKEGEGQVVLLSGEAGIGKSRLVRALREHLGEEPHTPLSQFCSPYHANTALHPVVGLLERAAGLHREDPPERQLDKLEAMLALAVQDVREGAALLADLLGIPAAGRYPSLDLSPQQRKERTFKVLLDQLAGLATRRPALALYEDAHWADPTTLELLGRVLERVQRLPVLALVTFRPGFVPPWAGHGHATALSLGRLGRRQGGAMVGRVTAGKVLPAEVLDQILARTDGVPLFVEELTKAVLESGLLTERGDHYELVGPLPPLAIPSTLQDSLMARLDRLAPIKEVAQLAACIGREFSHELIAAVAALPAPELDRALAELISAELVFPRGAPPDATYSFKHALVQDAAYQSLLKSRRQQLHARIGTVLEERFPEVAEARPEVLARHCAEAGLAGKAIAYSHRAARQAIARSAMTEAIAQLHQALEILPGLPDDVVRRRQELELQTTLGVPLIAIRGMAAPEVERAYARARELCLHVGEAPQLSSVLFGLWWFYEVRADLRAAHEVAERLLDMARRGEAPADLLQAHRAMGHTLLWMGEFAPALAHFERAIALYDPRQHRSLAFTAGQEPGVLARGFASHVLWYLGYPDRALATMREALSLAREVAHPFSLAFALDHAAWLHQYRRETAATWEGAEEDVGFSGEQGFPFFLAQGTILRGWALAEQERAAEGIAQMRQGLAGHEATGALLIRPYWFSLLARAYGRSGRAEDGLRVLSEALAMTHDQHVWEAELHRLKGELLLARPSGADDADAAAIPTDAPVAAPAGPPVEAEVCFRHALDVARGQQARSLELRAGTSLARLWEGQGKRAEARELLAPIYGWFTEGFDTSDLREAKALLDALR
jgi:class 3 adenylate cyclase/predicted ATPase